MADLKNQSSSSISPDWGNELPVTAIQKIAEHLTRENKDFLKTEVLLSLNQRWENVVSNMTSIRNG